MFIDRVKLIGIIVLVLIGGVLIISWRGLIGLGILAEAMIGTLFPITPATGKEISEPDMRESSAKLFCTDMGGKTADIWHSELRNNKKYDGKVTHVTIATNRRRYVYLLGDGSRLMISHVLVEKKPVVTAKVIHGGLVND